jgi:hypothetical protein
LSRTISSTRSRRKSRSADSGRGLGDGGDEVRGVGDARQRDEGRAVREAAGEIGGALQGQPRLADAAGAEQRHQASPVGQQRLAQARELGLPTDQLAGGQR